MGAVQLGQYISPPASIAGRAARGRRQRRVALLNPCCQLRRAPPPRVAGAGVQRDVEGAEAPRGADAAAVSTGCWQGQPFGGGRQRAAAPAAAVQPLTHAPPPHPPPPRLPTHPRALSHPCVTLHPPTLALTPRTTPASPPPSPRAAAWCSRCCALTTRTQSCGGRTPKSTSARWGQHVQATLARACFVGR